MCLTLKLSNNFFGGKGAVQKGISNLKGVVDKFLCM